MNLRLNTFTFRGLTLGDWAGVWIDRLRFHLCRLRGHQWGPWIYEAPDFSYGPACRMCDRCTAYEDRDR